MQAYCFGCVHPANKNKKVYIFLLLRESCYVSSIHNFILMTSFCLCVAEFCNEAARAVFTCKSNRNFIVINSSLLQASNYAFIHSLGDDKSLNGHWPILCLWIRVFFFSEWILFLCCFIISPAILLSCNIPSLFSFYATNLLGECGDHRRSDDSPFLALPHVQYCMRPIPSSTAFLHDCKHWEEGGGNERHFFWQSTRCDRPEVDEKWQHFARPVPLKDATSRCISMNTYHSH